MSFSAYATAAMMRDTIAQVVREVIQRDRPQYRYAVVDSVNTTTRRAMVTFSGEALAVPVRYGSIVPRAGALVRVGGLVGDRHVLDVIGEDFDVPGRTFHRTKEDFVLPAGGAWRKIAHLKDDGTVNPPRRGAAQVTLFCNTPGAHTFVRFTIGTAYNAEEHFAFTWQASNRYSNRVLDQIRIRHGDTYDETELIAVMPGRAIDTDWRVIVETEIDFYQPGWFADVTSATSTPPSGFTDIKKVVPPSIGVWQPITFLNGWINYDSGYATAKYMVDSTGMVHLRGLVRNGTDFPIGRVPECAPGGSSVNVTMKTGDAFERIDINADGADALIVSKATSSWHTLEHLSWPIGE